MASSSLNTSPTPLRSRAELPDDEGDSRPETGGSDPRQLTVLRREKLVAHLELDPKAVSDVRVTVDVAERAVNGQALEPAIVQKLAAARTGP